MNNPQRAYYENEINRLNRHVTQLEENATNYSSIMHNSSQASRLAVEREITSNVCHAVQRERDQFITTLKRHENHTHLVQQAASVELDNIELKSQQAMKTEKARIEEKMGYIRGRCRELRLNSSARSAALIPAPQTPYSSPPHKHREQPQSLLISPIQAQLSFDHLGVGVGIDDDDDDDDADEAFSFEDLTRSNNNNKSDTSTVIEDVAVIIQEFGELKKQLLRQTTKHETLKKELGEQKKLLKKKNDEIGDQVTQIEQVQKKYAEATNSHERTRSKLSDLQISANNNSETVKLLESQLANERGNIAELTLSNDELLRERNSSVEEIEQITGDLSRKLIDIEADQAQQIDNLNANHEEAVRELTQVAAMGVQEQQNLSNALDAMREKLATETTLYNANIEKAKVLMKKLKDDKVQVTEKLNQSYDELAVLKFANDELTVVTDELKEEAGRASFRFDELKETSGNAIKALRCENAELQNCVDERTSCVKKMELSLTDQRTKLDIVQLSKTESASAIDSLTSSLTSAKHENALVHRLLETARKENAALAQSQKEFEVIVDNEMNAMKNRFTADLEAMKTSLEEQYKNAANAAIEQQTHNFNLKLSKLKEKNKQLKLCQLEERNNLATALSKAVGDIRAKKMIVEEKCGDMMLVGGGGGGGGGEDGELSCLSGEEVETRSTQILASSAEALETTIASMSVLEDIVTSGYFKLK